MTKKAKILAVDDEAFNLDIINDYLSNDGYEVIGAADGLMALKELEANPDIDAIVLDRMMPNMDGLEFLKKVKQDPAYRDIPVIMQTAAALSEQVLQGIQAGVYYYLTKPYGNDMLLSIVRAALQDAKNKKEMKNEVRLHKRALGMMEQSRFRFRTLEETKNLAYFIASCFPEPEKTVYGLSELLINAVEHGNLGITYAEKTKLILSGSWQEEIERRLKLPENIEKFAYLAFEIVDNTIRIHIKDQGKGFDWQQYLEIAANRSTDPHGRGIAMSKMMSFHTMEYIGSGNEVVCTVPLSGGD